MASFDFLLLRCGLERPGAFSVMTTSLVVLRLLAKYSRNNPQESNLQKTHLIYRRVAKQGKMTQIFLGFHFTSYIE